MPEEKFINEKKSIWYLIYTINLFILIYSTVFCDCFIIKTDQVKKVNLSKLCCFYRVRQVIDDLFKSEKYSKYIKL